MFKAPCANIDTTYAYFWQVFNFMLQLLIYSVNVGVINVGMRTRLMIF